VKAREYARRFHDDGDAGAIIRGAVAGDPAVEMRPRQDIRGAAVATGDVGHYVVGVRILVVEFDVAHQLQGDRWPGSGQACQAPIILGRHLDSRQPRRLADLMAKFPPPQPVRYVSLETPGRGYYVGLDLASAMHPQTLLAWALNGEPLTASHGAPLRLAIPIKYGVKNIKRIATIRWTNVRPPDFWAERGYDWYCGH